MHSARQLNPAGQPQGAVEFEADTSLAEVADLWRILKRRAWMVVAIALVPVVAAVGYAAMATPMYTATVQIYVDPRERQVVSNDFSPTSLASDGGIAQVESQQRVIMSDAVLGRVVDDLELAADTEFVPDPRVGLMAALAGTDETEGSGRPPRLVALRELRKRVTVERASGVLVVDVSVRSRTPEKAAMIANEVARAYMDDRSDARAAAANAAADSLVSRLGELQRRVRDADNAVEEFKALNGIVDASGETRVDEQRLTEFGNQLSLARARSADALARIEQIELLRDSGADLGALAEAISSPVITGLRERYAEATERYAELTSAYGTRHPSIAAARAQLAELEGRLREELARIVDAARNDYERARANEREIQSDLDAALADTLDTEQALVRLRELEREVEAARAVYEAFMLRARETRELASIDTANVRVLSPATPPLSKSWPPTVPLLAAALVMGLCFGAGGAFVQEYAKPLIHSRGTLASAARTSVLAVVPLGHKPARGKRSAGARAAGLEAAGLALAARRVRSRLTGAADDQVRSLLLLPISAACEAVADELAKAMAAQSDDVLLVAPDEPEMVEVVGASGAPARARGRWRALVAAATEGHELVVVSGRWTPDHEPTQALVPTVDAVVLLVAEAEERQRVVDTAEFLRLSGAALSGAVFVTRR